MPPPSPTNRNQELPFSMLETPLIDTAASALEPPARRGIIATPKPGIGSGAGLKRLIGVIRRHRAERIEKKHAFWFDRPWPHGAAHSRPRLWRSMLFHPHRDDRLRLRFNAGH